MIAVFGAICGAPAQDKLDKQDEPVDLHGIKIDKDHRSITFPAEINMAQGMLEYLLVADTGKTHESLLSTKITPYDIQVAMLLLGAQPAGKENTQPPGQITRDYLKTAPQLHGPPVDIWLQWQGHRVRPEDMIWNIKDNQQMSQGPWTYNGSEIYDGKFLAQIDGSITAIVRDSAALMNSPRPGNDDDKIWEVNVRTVPPAGTAVDVVIQLDNAPTK